MTHGTGGFQIESWREEPYDERDEVKLTRTHVTKTFHGDLEGHGAAELLMAYAREGSAAYAGFERIDCHIDGRAGSFVLHHNASRSQGNQSASWTILSGSGTGELHAIRGEMQIFTGPEGEHTFTLDYELDGPPGTAVTLTE